jgi:dephospho-CoA kinase
MHKILAIVGMPGSGKTEVARYLEKKGFAYLRFGQVVLDEALRRGTVNEAAEREIRNGIRKQYGLGGVALLNIPKLDKLLRANDVVVDGLYSWEEYKILKEKYGAAGIIVVAVCAGAATRYARLTSRRFDPAKDAQAHYRSYSPEVAQSRDFDQIEQANQGGPIAMADRFILNEGSKAALYKAVAKMVF